MADGIRQDGGTLEEGGPLMHTTGVPVRERLCENRRVEKAEHGCLWLQVWARQGSPAMLGNEEESEEEGPPF